MELERYMEQYGDYLTGLLTCIRRTGKQQKRLWIGLMIASLIYFILPLVVQFTDKDTTVEDMKKGGF